MAHERDGIDMFLPKVLEYLSLTIARWIIARLAPVLMASYVIDDGSCDRHGLPVTTDVLEVQRAAGRDEGATRTAEYLMGTSVFR